MALRDDQSEALTSLREAVQAGKRRICMQAPTGYGKTVLASAIVKSARQRGKRVIFTVPTISLVDQTVEMLTKHGIDDIGVMQADHRLSNFDMPVQVASVQTLMKRTIPKGDLVLIDECHKLFQFYVKWMHPHTSPEWANVPFIGLSATPWTKGLGKLFDHFHRASSTQEMIDAGHLSPFKVYAPSHPDLSGISTVGDDYHEGELSERMREGRLVADAVETWKKFAEGRPTLCYAVDRAHAKALQEKFIAGGVPCGYQDAFTKDATYRKKDSEFWIEGRVSIKKKFHSGEYPVVVNVETLTTGIDWDVRCISMCRPTKSDILFVQTVGRGLRNAPGKDHCLILDHSDNHSRLGFVTDIDVSYTGLNDGKMAKHENRTDDIKLPKECPQCAYLKPPKCAQCPACGFIAKVVSNIKFEAGELRELKPKPKQKKEPRVYATMEEKATFLAELKYYGARQGYAAGWAARTYKEKFKVWPDSSIKDVAPAPWASADTMDYIKSRLIAYAKSKRLEPV